MSSRSATVSVIFIVAIIAFCFAGVCASITGPISILPNESESGGILDNLSAITDGTADSGNSYGYQEYDDYSSNDYSYSEDSSDDSDVETTTDQQSSNQESSNVETTTDSGSQSSDSSDVETTTDSGSDDSSSSSSSGSQSSSNVETTTG